MRCLMLTREGQKEGSNREFINRAKACLDSMGIPYDRNTADIINLKSATAKAALSETYDFILYPNHGSASAYRNVINSTDITLPLFGLAIPSAMTGTAIAANGAGIAGTSATSSKFFASEWCTRDWQAVNAAWFTGVAGTGVALMTQVATNPLDSSPQDEGYVGMWSFTMANGNIAYISSVFGEIPMLHFMIQAAINDGTFTAAQVSTLRKSPVMFEVDHINQTTNPDDVDLFANMVPPGGMMWCGIYNDHPTYFSNMNAAMAAKLKEHQDSGKLKYCWHTHPANEGYPWPTQGFMPYHDQGGTMSRDGEVTSTGASNDGTAGAVLEVTGETFITDAGNINGGSVIGMVCENTTAGTQTVIWAETETLLSLREDIFTGPGDAYEVRVPTKDDQDTYYQADKAIWESFGLEFNTGHYNSGANSWNEDTLALFSADVSVASSKANDVSKAGYGFTSARFIANGSTGTGNTASTRRIATRQKFRENYHHDVHMMRGIQLIPTFDMGFSPPNQTIGEWEDLFKMQCYQMANAMTIYMHMADMNGVQDPGVNLHGVEFAARVADYSGYLKDVSLFFADPTVYNVPPVNN